MTDATVADGAPYVTREQVILIASRLFSAYLLFWVIDDLTILPREILPVVHYIRESGSVLGANTSLPQTTYLLRSYMLELFDNVLHMALWLLGARWFYRCGPRIRSFFLPEEEAGLES